MTARTSALPRYEIATDGKTVWVNTANGCIGRFGLQGVDIHHEPLKQMERGSSECLFCTHGPVSRADWELFVAKMLELHKVTVPQRYMPRRFRG
jgi:hypothetical protein